MSDNTTNDTPIQLPLLFPPEYVEIELSKGGRKYDGLHKTIVDKIDSDLATMEWIVVNRAGKLHVALTKKVNAGEKKTVYIHRVILERVLGRPLSTDEIVDHINGDGLLNIRSNLRLATVAQNIANSPKSRRNTSGFKGVTWAKHANKFRAYITFERKLIHLGYFDTPELAHEAYCKKAVELFGEFANFGNE